MSTIEESIEVQVPVTTAYNQWTQFEEFPRFMEGVEEVRQLDDTTTHWKADIGGQHREFDARITEQRPDQRIAWCTVNGPNQSGVVTFHRLDDDTTRVMLQMEFEPEGIAESVGDKLGFVRRRTKGDLERFRDYMEARGRETGAWRGEVDTPGGRTDSAAGAGGARRARRNGTDSFGAV
ncbi:MAG: SRPBCC family protein [Actinobacteria bacterium]|nr:SRPBCC family protein [Actinomycetota bacterium]